MMVIGGNDGNRWKWWKGLETVEKNKVTHFHVSTNLIWQATVPGGANASEPPGNPAPDVPRYCGNRTRLRVARYCKTICCGCRGRCQPPWQSTSSRTGAPTHLVHRDNKGRKPLDWP